MRLICRPAFALLVLCCILTAVPARAEIVVTEIFYNLFGSESGDTEWIEIANTGDLAIDLSGWTYGDSQDNVFALPFPQGTILGAREVAVIVNQNPDVFRSIWGPDIRVLTSGAAISLANGASPTNETVAIRNASEVVIDDVNYDVGNAAGNTFPGMLEGRSIYLLGNSLNQVANNNGANWALSTIGLDGAYQALIANPGITTGATAGQLDIASPGFVSGLVAIPEPSAAGLLLAIGFVAASVRRRK